MLISLVAIRIIYRPPTERLPKPIYSPPQQFHIQKPFEINLNLQRTHKVCQNQFIMFTLGNASRPTSCFLSGSRSADGEAQRHSITPTAHHPSTPSETLSMAIVYKCLACLHCPRRYYSAKSTLYAKKEHGKTSNKELFKRVERNVFHSLRTFTTSTRAYQKHEP